MDTIGVIGQVEYLHCLSKYSSLTELNKVAAGPMKGLDLYSNKVVIFVQQHKSQDNSLIMTTFCTFSSSLQICILIHYPAPLCSAFADILMEIEFKWNAIVAESHTVTLQCCCRCCICLASSQLTYLHVQHTHTHTYTQTPAHTHTPTTTFHTHRTSLTFKHVSRAYLVSCSCCLNYIHHICTYYTHACKYIYAYISAWISAYLTACHACVYPAVCLPVCLLFLLQCSLSH